MSTINSYEDLIIWQRAHQLTLHIYKLTKLFPTSERYGITSQVQRAISSVPANIVEGFARFSQLEKQRFYNIALASLEEAHYFCGIAHDLGYLEFNFQEDFLVVRKLLRSFIKNASTQTFNF